MREILGDFGEKDSEPIEWANCVWQDIIILREQSLFKAFKCLKKYHGEELAKCEDCRDIQDIMEAVDQLTREQMKGNPGQGEDIGFFSIAAKRDITENRQTTFAVICTLPSGNWWVEAETLIDIQGLKRNGDIFIRCYRKSYQGE